MRLFPLLALSLTLAACDMLGESNTAEENTATFDAGSIVWEEVEEAPIVRFEAQSAAVDGKLYTFGGYTDPSIIPKNFEANVYDPKSDTWQQLPDMPRPITHAGTAEDGQNIYLAGGVVGSYQEEEERKFPASTEVWKFDTQTQEWSAIPPLPEPRGAGALVVLGSTLHYFGGTGIDRYQEVSDHWVLEVGSEGWETRAPLDNPRNHLAGIVVKGEIYAIGGQYGHNETLVTQDTVERYDPQTDSWDELTPLPYGLGHKQNTTFEVDGRIYIVGGETSGYGVKTSEVLVYDPELDAWSQTTNYPTAAKSLIGGAIGNSIYITGGSERSFKTLKGTIRK
jgi:N-acetylneuraminic acid mutarotase